MLPGSNPGFLFFLLLSASSSSMYQLAVWSSGMILRVREVLGSIPRAALWTFHRLKHTNTQTLLVVCDCGAAAWRTEVATMSDSTTQPRKRAHHGNVRVRVPCADDVQSMRRACAGFAAVPLSNE